MRIELLIFFWQSCCGAARWIHVLLLLLLAAAAAAADGGGGGGGGARGSTGVGLEALLADAIRTAQLEMDKHEPFELAKKRGGHVDNSSEHETQENSNVQRVLQD